MDVNCQRRRRAVGRVAFSLVVLSWAGIAYLGSPSTSPVGALRPVLTRWVHGSPMTIPYAVRSPAPSPHASRSSLGISLAEVSSVLIEQFAVRNSEPSDGRLESSVLISESTMISNLLHQLEELPVFPLGVVSCASSDNGYFALVFTYIGGSGTQVKIEAGGCGRVYIGGSSQPAAWILTSPGILNTLKRSLAMKADRSGS